jgi:hypothetical protein
LGGVGDYLTLAAVGSPNTSYLNSTQVGTGVLNRTWTVTMPTTAGQYEFRLFSSSKREATSPPVTVDPTFNHVPTLNTIAPVAAAAGGPGFTLTLNGTRFVTSSVVRWNGNARPTTFISSTQLTAAIGAADIAAVGTAQVTVETPPPGGGASTALTFAINPPPSIAVSATTVAGGASVTATLSNGLGGAYDWLALASTTAPNTSYLKFIYIGSGVTTRAWTVAMPTTIGTYEFRLFLNNGYTRAATSPAVAVTSTAPILTSLSPASAPVGGAAFTLSVHGSGFTTGSAVRWNGAERATTFVSASQLQAAIPATDLNAAGTAQVTVAAPGGAVSAALPFQIGGAVPVLTASATTVNGGSPLTVTLTNGLGGTTDWMSFATTSAPGGSYVQYTYVGAGVTTRTWTINAPSVAGTYEFRLLPNNGTTIVARSAPVTVSVQAPVLSVNTTSAARGTPVTVTLTGGYGGSGDWMSFAATSSPNTSYVTYTYVGAGVTTRTWTVTMPQTPGTYEFRLFPNNGYTRAATSPPITVY